MKKVLIASTICAAFALLAWAVDTSEVRLICAVGILCTVLMHLVDLWRADIRASLKRSASVTPLAATTKIIVLVVAVSFFLGLSDDRGDYIMLTADMLLWGAALGVGAFIVSRLLSLRKRKHARPSRPAPSHPKTPATPTTRKGYGTHGGDMDTTRPMPGHH